MIEIANHGPLITATDYWRSDYARHGRLIVSPNAGAIRCLIPPALAPVLGELRSAQYAVASRGAWNGADALEIMWEDGTDSPHAWHVTAESCVGLPSDPGQHEWIITCWVERDGAPHKAIERRCYWRRVPMLPCLAPWTGRMT